MPPNVKEVAAVLKNLDVSGLTVRQKYLPLTHPQEQEQHEQRRREEEEKRQPQEQEQEEEYVTAEHVADPTHPAQSYWDWESNDGVPTEEKKQKVIAKILEEEEIRQMLSVESIEKKLVEQAKSDKDVVVSSGEEEIEGYWDMPARDKDEPAVAPSLGTDHIIVNLIADAALVEQRESTVEYVYAPHVGDDSHPANAYWDEECHVTEEEKHESLIDTILREERCRLAVETGNIEQHLLKDASSRRSNAAGFANPVSAESDKYWLWNSTAPEIIQAPHVGDDSHPANAYWDWETYTVCDIKQKMIEEIMAEEKIRVMLSADHVEERLREGRQEECKEEVRNGEVTAGAESSYWDW